MKYTLLLLSIISVGCASSGMPDLPSAPTFRKPSSSAKVYKPKREWVIRGIDDLEPLKKLGAEISEKGSIITVDLKGIVIDGSNQKGDGGESERQTPLFRAYTPLVIKNGFFHNNKNAATYYKPNSGAINITCTEIGEDAIATADGATNFLLQGCEFRDGYDKSGQLNEAKGAKVINNIFYGGRTGLRIGKISYSSKSDVATCGGNKFYGCDIGIGVGKIELRVEGKKNTFVNVNHPYRLDGGARVINPDGAVKDDN